MSHDQPLRHGLAICIAVLALIATALGDLGWPVLAAATVLLVVGEVEE